MDGTKHITGEKYRFKVKDYINGGGNGQVFHVQVLNSDLHDNYVVKFFKKCKRIEETNKRYKRFFNEVNTIIKIENEIEGVLPVIDFHLPKEYSMKDEAWYVMPLANDSSFLYKEEVPLEMKITSLIELGKIISKLHDLGYTHRDIKPNNILIKNNQVILSDYGLVWNEEYDGLTTSSESVGPHLFIAPEMRQNANLIKNPNPADIYSFGQVIWCMLKNELKGIGETFDRKDPNLLFENLYDEYTFEPIYTLLEFSTQRNPASRPTIKECIDYLTDFKEILANNQEILSKWNRVKINYIITNNIEPSQEVYLEKTKIVDIINILKSDYIIEENSFTSEMVLESCISYKDGIVLRRKGNGNSFIEYLCFPNRLVRTFDKGEKNYKLKIKKIIINRSEYEEFFNYIEKNVPVFLGELKTYINLDMELKFIPKKVGKE